MEREYVLEDNIRQEDAAEIKKCIRQTLDNGYRFVCFPVSEPSLRAKDFIGFRSLIDAQEYAINNTNNRDFYIVRSTVVVDKEMDGLINNVLFKQGIMNENVMSFNENQLKRVGMGEAFTPDLLQKMQEKQPNIQHAFQKEYNGDKVEALLYLRKSATSDHYFLNKFDLTLQKEGAAASIKQTFYTSAPKNNESKEDGEHQKKQQNKYTLKEGYNLLAGRPVFKDLVTKEGKEYQAWEKLNSNKVLQNGNHEIKRYTEAYGFDLKGTLAKYPIKELLNEDYTKSLMESLQRGNLQKVTFTNKEGQEEKLFISPNIPMGALNVYDQDKQRIPTEKLVEKQYLGKEVAEEMKQRISAIQASQKPDAQSIAEQSVSQKQTKQSTKIRNEKPASGKAKQKIR